MNTNCIVAQSGGPTSAINASLAGVIKAINDSDMYDTVYGSLHGVTGVLNEDFINLTDICKSSDDFLICLSCSPAMFLGSCRYKLPDHEKDNSDYKRIFNTFEKLNIGAFFYIGGNDSMDTAAKLTAYAKIIGSDVRIVGIPKTIDNDLICTDHTPGFGSAAKYIATSILEMAHDTFIYELQSVTIAEIMGRDAGWLTAASALARNKYNDTPQLIYLPEVAFSFENFLRDVREKLRNRNNILIAVSEGIRDKSGEYISCSKSSRDIFGHSQLSGVGKTLEQLIKNEIGIKCRSVELNILQRCASHISSKTDINEAFNLGYSAVKHSEAGNTGFMASICRDSTTPYVAHVEYVDVAEVANKVKSVPRNWISPAGNDVSDELVEYIRPLIQGETETSFENGLPRYTNMSHLISHSA